MPIKPYELASKSNDTLTTIEDLIDVQSEW